MEAIAAILIGTLSIASAASLAVLRAGIRRQERTASLTSQPHGFAAALTRRLCGLHVTGTPGQPVTGRGAAAPLEQNGAEVTSA